MMYSEFIEGTGCKDNQHNYEVFKNLEIMYMNSDMSKAEIYEYGKKLVDNSKTEEQIRFEQEIKNEIESYKEAIKYAKGEIARMQEAIDEDCNFWKDFYKGSMKHYKDEIKSYRIKINELKWVLA